MQMKFPHLRRSQLLPVLLAFLTLSAIALAHVLPVMSNEAVWKAGLPVSLPSLREVATTSTMLYQPETQWTYSHHPFITVFKGRAYAIWSNGRRDEDAPGQRVLISSSADFKTWSPPRPLMQPHNTADGIELTLTAAGFHQYRGTLIAYVASYGPDTESPRLFLLETTDGTSWTAPVNTGLRVVPSRGPEPSASGRLIIAGNIAFPWTDDPAGISGWHMAGLYPKEQESSVTDDPKSFHEISIAMGWGAELCEGSLIRGEGGILRMALRNAAAKHGGKLWLTESTDDGVSWSRPFESEFSDTNAKFHFGQLPDGRHYYVGAPIGTHRFPLVVSLSDNGYLFNRHFVVGSNRYSMNLPGRWKGGEYGYPNAIVHKDVLHIIVSRQKEAIEVISVPLTAFSN
jgi:BNR repeat-like domain